MKYLDDLKYIKTLKMICNSAYENNAKLIAEEKQLAEFLVLRIMHHFDSYKKDTNNISKITTLSECEEALKSLTLNLKYYKEDEIAIKKEHAFLLEIIDKKNANYRNFKYACEQLMEANKTKFLKKYDNRFREMEHGRLLAKITKIDFYDTKDFIQQAIYSRFLVFEPIDYKYLNETKKQLQEMREKFLVASEQNSTKQNTKDNVMEQ